MDVSGFVGQDPFNTSKIWIDKSSQGLMGAKPKNKPLAKGPIEDNFLTREEATAPAVKFSSAEEFKAFRKAAKLAAIDAASGEEKKDLEMRMYWGEYTDVFSGGSPNGWRNLNMETMYAQASDIYKQIEESSDSQETKALKLQALQNALSTGTGMYKMRMVGEKMMADARKDEAQGKTIDRSFRSKAKFEKLSKMSNAFHNITATFFNNLKNGKTDGVDYGAMISDATNKIMAYSHNS